MDLAKPAEKYTGAGIVLTEEETKIITKALIVLTDIKAKTEEFGADCLCIYSPETTTDEKRVSEFVAMNQLEWTMNTLGKLQRAGFKYRVLEFLRDKKKIVQLTEADANKFPAGQYNTYGRMLTAKTTIEQMAKKLQERMDESKKKA